VVRFVVLSNSFLGYAWGQGAAGSASKCCGQLEEGEARKKTLSRQNRSCFGAAEGLKQLPETRMSIGSAGSGTQTHSWTTSLRVLKGDRGFT
jgi:hypothetical protein